MTSNRCLLRNEIGLSGFVENFTDGYIKKKIQSARLVSPFIENYSTLFESFISLTNAPDTLIALLFIRFKRQHLWCFLGMLPCCSITILQELPVKDK